MALSEAVFEDFEDHFPSMILRLGAEGFVGELCYGFHLLMDCEKGVITYESLKINSLLLGLDDMADDEIECMLREGDLDGDGNINQFEFCILMCRMSPVLMDGSMQWMWMSSEVCPQIIQPGVSTA